MPLSLTQFNTTFGHLLDDLPITVTIGGDDFTGNLSRKIQNLELRDREFIDNFTFTVILQQSDFGTIPERGSLLTFEAVEYRVMEVERSVDDVGLRLHCGNRYSNAL